MLSSFIKKNWLYIILFCFIIAVNVLPRIEKPTEEAQEEVTVEEKTEEPATLYLEFEEAQSRSKKVEGVLKKNLPLTWQSWI